MNKVINGKRYDTDTAEPICAWTPSDWANECRGLYRKRTGEYFLWRWHNLYGGAIEPLTSEEAREYGEAHMTGDNFQAEFGEAPE